MKESAATASILSIQIYKQIAGEHNSHLRENIRHLTSQYSPALLYELINFEGLNLGG